jgi:type IV pilus assembly protein PilP
MISLPNRIWTVVLMALLLALLSACVDEQDNLNRYIAEVKARPAAPIPPIPAVQTYTPYVYDGLAGRDPRIDQRRC